MAIILISLMILESVIKMNVIEIRPNGFCNGVHRAIKMVDDILKDPNTPKPIYMFGNLVHNKSVVDMYKDKITIILDDYDKELDKINNGTVIFTAHGIAPHFIDKAKSKGLNIVNTTCPRVLKVHKMIKQKLDDGYYVLVIGKETHPEVLSYLGISDNIKLYDDKFVPINRTFIVNQTTLIYEDVLKIYEKLKSTYENVEIACEICNATKVRQQALYDYRDDCDAFIIVGDKLSNNCTSLYEVARTMHPAYKIESKDELDAIDLTRFKKIGVTAGASTPKHLLNEVIEKIKALS